MWHRFARRVAGRSGVGRRVPRCTTNVIPSVRRSSSSSTAVSDAPPEWAARLLATTTAAVPPRHLCFDLDHTLWDFTVEWEGAFTPMDAVAKYVPAARPRLLQQLQANGHTLHVCSRSSEPGVCAYLLRLAYPGIQFASLNIFPTPANKYVHVVNALGSTTARLEPWWFFDDEMSILTHLKETWPHATLVHTPRGICTGYELGVRSDLQPDC